MYESTPGARSSVPAGSRRGALAVAYRMAAAGTAAAVLWLAATAAVIVREVFPRAQALPQRADVIVVLGAAAYGTRPSPVLRERLRHALHLYQAGIAPKLLCTGGRQKATDLTEAEVARRWMLNAGVADEDILLEDRSRSTQGNLANAAAVMRSEELRSVVLVSDPLHLARARLIAEGLGLEVQTSATPTTRFRTLRTKLPFLLRECGFYWTALLRRVRGALAPSPA